MSGGDDGLAHGRALVVFSGQADLWWLRLLRPGFRHCFVVLEGAGGWVAIDALSHRTMLAQIPKIQEQSLVGWYRRRGLTVVSSQIISPKKRMAPPLPYSCVESVKRILGIHACWMLTPWQLFRHLNKRRTMLLTEWE